MFWYHMRTQRIEIPMKCDKNNKKEVKPGVKKFSGDMKFSFQRNLTNKFLAFEFVEYQNST